jgi:hypothetical protein
MGIAAGMLCLPLLGQFPGLSLPPSGGNQRAAVTQFIGPVKVEIEYHSPRVHQPDGTDRRGKIWGTLVPYGLTDLGFGPGKPAPWRAGANENTVFSVSHAVKVQGQPLPAGRYGLHVIVEPEEWTLIFSRNSTAWGSFFYEEKDDALRVKVKPRKHDYREWLTYEFTERGADSAQAELQWEDLSAAWRISVDGIQSLYISRMSEELRNVTGFQWAAYVNAIQYCLQAKTGYEQALEWAEIALTRPFVGERNFTTLRTKGLVLERLGRTEEARNLHSEAIRHPGAGILQIHQYGRELLASKRTAEAMEVFQFNLQRFGSVWPVHVGLARGYMAVGDNAKALENARKAVTQAPDPLNRRNLEAMVKALEEGRPFGNE